MLQILEKGLSIASSISLQTIDQIVSKIQAFTDPRLNSKEYEKLVSFH